MSRKDSIFRPGLELAVIGMSGRFPGACNIDEFFQNLKNGVESITFFSRQELEELGVAQELIDHVDYVNAKAGLENVGHFDASFFGYTAGEADMMDPQMRLFHECAWEALEHAGINPGLYKGLIGVYAGGTPSAYWEALTLFGGTGGFSDTITSGGLTETFGKTLFNDKDMMSTWISYKFDLRGPSNTMFSSCSTSLVVIHTACQAILSGECDIALAGGVSVMSPERNGYLYQEGLIVSADGHCRAFDAEASGTVFGDGIGVVVLKLLEKALEDSDTIYAVVKSTAVNNDGGRKVGFTAPSVEGQEEVIRMAHQLAEIEPHQVGYVEAHGTGTIIGDPIEFEALKRAFGPVKPSSCALGSVKTNVGHLNSAAGVCGFIKTVLSLYYGLIFPSLNFKKPNPNVDLENSPFYINTELKKWGNHPEPLIAGVSSFGVGGTNAHMILCEAPEKEEDHLPVPAAQAYRCLLLSTKTGSALKKMTANLADYFKKNPRLNLADAAYTLQLGRKTFSHRKMLVCSEVKDAVEAFSGSGSENLHTAVTEKNDKSLVFMFPGQGAQYVNMGLGLYRSQPLFRNEMDRCFDLFKSIMGYDIKEIIYPSPGVEYNSESNSSRINQTEFAQPLLFIFEYALAKLLMSWGIEPYAMIGHSIGEYVAACLAGVFSLEDALTVVAFRGKLMQQLPDGSMVSISLPEKEFVPLLTEEISLAAINTPESCVVSGAHEDMDALVNRLEEEGHMYQRLHTSHAFHSLMMEPILFEFTERLEGIKLNKPQIPFISNLSGQPITVEEATAPRYWARHLRETVRFSAGLQTLLEHDCIFVEIGPGKTLSSFVNQHKKNSSDKLAVNLAKHPKEDVSDDYYLLSKIGQLWLYGVTIDWRQFYPGERRTCISLPTYPFEGKRFWFDLKKGKFEPGIQVKLEADKNLDNMNDRYGLSTGYTLPSNEIEQILAESWQKFFGINSIGIDDDFFELGGDSLKSSIIISKIHKKFNVKIPIAEFFKRPTIRGLALFIADNAGANIHLAVEPAEAKEYYNLSSAQKRIYILNEMDKNGISYNESSVLNLEGNIVYHRFEDTFMRLIKRHESLRTFFEMMDGGPVQKMRGEVKPNIQYYDLGVDVNLNEKKINDIIKDFIRPFDLSRAPLLRVGLIKRTENQHLLMIDMHHIISDGTSMEVLVRESMVYYKGEELPELRIQYKDFSEWQNSEKVRDLIKEQEEYWLKQFEGEIPLLNLPLDYPRPLVQSFEGSTVSFELARKDTQSLKKYAQEEGVTLYILLLAITNIMLSKVSSQEDIVIGTPIAGRRHTDLGKIIGMFVNTLAMRNYPIGEKTFRVFLADVKERALEAFELQEYQFEDLVEKVAATRDASRNPLFDVLFALQNLDFPTIEIPGLKSYPYNFEKGISKFDLTLSAFDIEESLQFTLEFCTSLFKKETIERFIAFFKQIVAVVLKDPVKKISGIEIISEEEKTRILTDFNNTDAKYPWDKTIYEMFEKQVERTPDSISIVGITLLSAEKEMKQSTKGMAQREGAGEVVPPMVLGGPIFLTYKQLNGRSYQLAQRLVEKGVEPDSIVVVMTERSVEMIVGILGILKAGGAYLPIVPEYPEKRKQYLVADSSASVLLTQKRFGKNFREICEVIYIDDADLYRGEDKTENFNKFRSKPENLAYLIYTSGSTGKPKGVVVEQRAVVNRINWMQVFYPIGQEDVILQKTTFMFDVSVWELFWWSFYGASICLLGFQEEKNPEAIIKAIEKSKITTIHFVPSMLNLFHEYLEDSPDELNKLSSLRQVFSSGEALLRHQVERFNRLLHKENGTKLINLYGPTEATVDVSYFNCSTGKIFENTTVPIGKPIKNIHIYIVNEALGLQPVGLVGDLCIGGIGLARGYLNKPELTGEKFVECRFIKGERLFKTGDLAKWLPDGNIEFLGRIDHQIKIRGNRIELGDIELQLLAHDEIKEAVVVAKSDRNGNTHLRAYIVSNKTILAVELRERLSENLPDYMLPSFFVTLEKMPLTPSGKIDRKRLPEPGANDLSTGIHYCAPSSKIERELTNIWQKVLGIKTIGTRDNFFEIGGDSIKAIQIISRMKKVGYKLEMQNIFRNPRIADLATLVKRLEQIPDQSLIIGTVLLTPIQKRFFENQTVAANHFNQAVMLFREDGFDEKILEAVFMIIQEHHDALRMTFKKENDEVIQVNNGMDYPFSLEVNDLRQRENVLQALEQKANELQASINLAVGPLMKLALFHLDDGDRLLIVCHHLVIDGISWRILLEDIETLYRQYENGEQLSLPLKSDSFKTWSDKLSQYAGSEKFLEEKIYWAKLEAQEIQSIKKDFDNEENYMKDVETLSFILNEEETNLLLMKTNEAFGTEINDILLTALGIAVKGVFGNSCLLVALEGHGREEILEDIDVSRTVGWFTILYPVLLDFSYHHDHAVDANLARLVKEVKESLRQLPNRGIGYGILKYLTSGKQKKDLNFRLNPQLVFNYLGQFDEDMEEKSFKMAKESVGSTHDINGRREFELDVHGMVTGKRLVISIDYSTVQYKAETIKKLLNHFEKALSHTISFCSGRQGRELTPSDFSYPKISIDVLDRLQEKFSHTIEDIYTLTPMQEGMLFHSLYDKNSLAYFEQISYRLKGELDIALFEKSLRKLIDRYGVLRTVFVHEELERPVQAVLKYPQTEFTYQDIGYPADPGSTRPDDFIKEFKEKDKHRPFDLSKDALMRVAVIRVDENEYELIWSHHHILIDGWCLGILIAEYFEFYNSCLENRPPELPPVKSYLHYIKWLEKLDKKESKEYWRAYLDTYEQLATIPGQRVLNTSDGSEGEVGFRRWHMNFFLGEEETDQLNKLAGGNNVTLNTIMQATWGVILGRYNGKQDVVFGSVVSGRPSEIESVESIVGLFLNTIPVRIRYEGETTFNQLLRVMQKEALESEKYHHYPLAEIQSEHRLKQSLLDHIFVFENYPLVEQIEGMKFGNNKTNLQISNTEIFEQTNYNLHIMVIPGTSLQVDFIFNALVYEEYLMHTVLQHFKDLVGQIIENPGIQVRAIEKITAGQKQEILLQLNRELSKESAEFEDGNHTIQKRLTKHFPEDSINIAIQQGDKNITYGELDEKSNFIAHWIVNMGLPKETFIGVLIDDKVDIIITMIGILKAGCVFIPLDSAHPLDRVKIMVDSTDTKVLISNGINFNEFAPRIMGDGNEKEVKIFLIEEMFSVGHSSWYAMPPKIEYYPQDKIYIYFTSGTTGHPRAIVGKNKGLCHFIDWEIKTMQVDETFHVSQFTNPGFDAFLRDILLPLCTGGVICIPERKEILLDAGELVDWIERSDINLIHCVPALFRSINSISLTGNNFETLKYILLSGEKLEPAGFVNWFEIFKDRIKLVNLWGTSETTLAKTCYFIQPSDVTRERVPVGHPIHGCRVVVLDENLQLCGELVTGELYIATPFRSFGYYNDPRMNQERFIKNPFNINPDAVLHKTGDLGRLLPGGNIDVLGRNDRQVKIRGIRIELEGIENVLVRNPWVNEAVVLKKEKSNNNEFLCAYVTCKETNHTEDDDAVISALKQYLLGQLPEYMIPTKIIKMKEIPRTPNGKVDYKKLPEPFEDKKKGIIGPINRVERKILDFWSEILGIEKSKIYITDHFFEVGGNSLNIMSLISRIHREFDIRISLGEMFKNATIQMQAGIIKAANEEKFIPITAVEEKEYWALSTAQKRLYVLQQFDLGSTAYNMPHMVILEGKLEKRVLENIFNKLINRHESLRTSFILLDEQPVQRVHSEVEFEIEYYQVEVEDKDQRTEDGRQKTEEKRLTTRNGQQTTGVKTITYPSSVIRHLSSEFIRSFDLSHAPLLRVGLIHTPRLKDHSSQEGNFENRYILMVDMHHIISDGVSYAILDRDFMDLYKGKNLSPLPFQYKDFSEWEQLDEQKKALVTQKEYWLKEFEDDIPVLHLPTDYTRPAVQSFEGNTIDFEIAIEETNALNQLAKKEDVTLYIILVTAVNILFAKLSNQEDIIIGTPVANRRHVDLEQIIGMYVNTLALRNHLKEGDTFSNFLQSVKENTLNAFENQDYPFEEIVDHVSIDRNLSRNPLFDIMFVMQNMDFPKMEIPDLKLFPYKYKSRISKFDIVLSAWLEDGKLLFSFEYCTKIFKKGTIDQFISYFKKIINLILMAPMIKISDIDIISEEEKKKILYDFNDTDAEYPGNKIIHKLFEEQVERTPDHVALVGQSAGLRAQSEDEPLARSSMHCALTYKELNKKSNQLAHLLKKKGVQPDIIVGIMSERSIEMIAGILGILKSGGAYLPIEPEYPKDRIDYILKDSAAAILLNQNDLLDCIGKRIACFNFLPEPSNCNSTTENLQTVTSMAYIIYTSGTTGRPKGTIIEHRNVVRLMINNKFQFDFSDTDIWTMFHSFCFDFSVWEIYGSLLYGGKLIVIPKITTRDMERYLNSLKKLCVTVLNQTPSAFYNLSSMELSSARNELSIRYVIFGGEALRLSRLKEWKAKYPATKLINMYGITETTVHVTFKEILDSDIESNISNIGKPIPTLTTYVIDTNLKLQPLGVSGELVVGGKGVGRGYLNRPELSSKKFVQNPYKAGERLYKSGDLVKLLSMGDLEYLGRIDYQVKIRGYRIELGEIENCLLSHKNIKEAAVIDREYLEGDKYLCAYFVWNKSKEKCGRSELIQYLSKKLPGYMVPSYFVEVEKIPLTANGKLDRKLLLTHEFKEEGIYVAPRNQIEEKLVEIWCKILDRDMSHKSLGINDNFFHSGGHSLKATALISKINKELEIKIPLVEIFKNPTIKELSAYIQSVSKDINTSLEPAEKKEYYPLSYAQKRIYTALQLEMGITSYNMAVILRLTGELDSERLQGTFLKLIERHESLRTSFEIIGNEPVQRVHDKVEFTIEYCSGGEVIVALREYIRSFDLTRAPLLRVYLSRIGEREYAMMIDISHLISDGVTSMLMAKELMTLYNRQELPLLNIQYKDFSEWENCLFRTGNIKKQENFWLDAFKGELPILELPTDSPRPEVRNVEAGDTISIVLKESIKKKLYEIIGETNSTLFTILLAVYTVLLNKYSGQEDIVVGSVVTGRMHEDLENVMGVFINMLPLRNRPQPGKRFRNFLEEVKENTLHALENQDYPMEELVKKLEIRNKPGRHPLFDTEFAVNNIEFEEIAIPGLKMENYDSGINFAKFDLHFLAIERNDSLNIILRYSTELFKKTTAEKIIGHFIEITEQVMENPGIKLDDIEITIDFMSIKPNNMGKELGDFNF